MRKLFVVCGCRVNLKLVCFCVLFIFVLLGCDANKASGRATKIVDHKCGFSTIVLQVFRILFVPRLLYMYIFVTSL